MSPWKVEARPCAHTHSSNFFSFKSLSVKKIHYTLKEVSFHSLFLNDAVRLAKSNGILIKDVYRLRTFVAAGGFKVTSVTRSENENSHVEPSYVCIGPMLGESRQADAHKVKIDSFLCFSRGQFVGAVLTMLNSCYWS